MAIKAKNLSFWYSPNTPFAKKALDDVTFEVEEGDFFGIIGHTGSGKSTLIQHFNALIKLQSGELSVQNIDLSKRFDYKALRGEVGMVFQYPEYQLFDETVIKDVSFGPRNLGLNEQQARERAIEALELVGLNVEEIGERSPFEISGGQRRKAAIAGVIAMKPKILVLDEPTAGLDPAGKREVLALVRRIKESCAHTIIMISHNMDEIAENCNKIAVMNKGKVEMILPPRELFEHGERLVELGLGVPNVTQVAMMLHKKGFDINPSIIDEDELKSQCLKIFAKEGAQE